MPVRRSTWRESPGRWLKASAVHARWWRPARRARRSIGCAKPRLVFPDDADDHALHDDVALIEAQWLQRIVRRLQPDPPAGLAVKPLYRGAFSMDECDHRLAGVGLVAFLDDDVVAVLDMLGDHRVAAHLQDVAAATPGQQLIGYGDGFTLRHGLDRRAGGDQTQQRQLRRPGLTLGRNDLDRPALVVRAPDVPFALEIREVLVNRRQRLKPELAGNLLETGGVALLFDVFPDEIEDLALAPRDRHTGSRRFTEP